jgi:hypothetical protein
MVPLDQNTASTEIGGDILWLFFWFHILSEPKDPFQDVTNSITAIGDIGTSLLSFSVVPEPHGHITAAVSGLDRMRRQMKNGGSLVRSSISEFSPSRTFVHELISPRS